MSRKLKGSAIVDSSVTGTQIETALVNKITDAYNQANAAYGQANTGSTSGSDAYNQANAAYGQANAAYGQANNARSDANTTFATINTTFGTVNTSLGTVNTSLGTINTNYQAAYAQANTARTTANDAYAAANTKLATSGGSISGDLSITGNLTVQGNATTINVSNLSVNDSIMLLAAGGTGDSLDIGFIGHIQRGATDTHVGLIRKATENQFYLFDNYEVEPTNNIINVSGNNFRLANLKLGIANANTFVTSAGLDVTGQANAAYGQANAAYGAANNRVLKAGDTMTGQLNISSGGLLVTGNVGIGTASPSRRLSIDGGAGTATWTGYQQGGTERFVVGLDASGNPSVYGTQNAPMIFYTNNIDRARITSDGNVAIGTASAGQRLTVNGGIESLVDSGGGVDEGGQLILRAPSGGNTRWSIDNFQNKFRIFREDDSTSANGAAAFHIINGGNVGIGTASPAAKLQVSQATPSGVGSVPADVTAIMDNTANNFLMFRTSADNNSYAGLLFMDNNVGGSITFRNYAGSGANDGTNGDAMYYHAYTDHIFQNGTTGSVNGNPERLRITQAGNVGIGITSPEASLHIAKIGVDEQLILGSSATNRDISISMYSGTTKAEVLRFQSSAVVQYGLGSAITQHNFNISGSNAMRLTSSGLFIGGTSQLQSASLSVYGSIAARNSGVDGTFANAFFAQYTGNSSEHNVIQTAVSVSGTQSGFRFKVSDGAGASTTTTALDLLRTKTIFYTGSIEVNSPTASITFTNSDQTKRGIAGTTASDDYWFVGGGSTAYNAGFAEISTGDDGTEPIYARQYSGAPLTGTVSRTFTMLDSSGDTVFHRYQKDRRGYILRGSYDWHWLARRYSGYAGDVRTNISSYFWTTTDQPVDSQFLHTDDLNAANYIGENIWGDVHNYRAWALTYIYVERAFTVTNATLNGDDPYALYIDKAYVTGADSCCSGVSYTYTFQPGWRRIEMIYSEQGGGHYVSLGWNPKNYTAYIKAMTPFGPASSYG